MVDVRISRRYIHCQRSRRVQTCQRAHTVSLSFAERGVGIVGRGSEGPVGRSDVLKGTFCTPEEEEVVELEPQKGKRKMVVCFEV